MITAKKTVFVALLFGAITFNACSMELEKFIEHQTSFRDYIEHISNILLGNIQLKRGEHVEFVELAPEIQSKIAGFLFTINNTNDLLMCGKTISSLAQVNHELNTLINNPDFCLKLIKHLAQRFDCSDEVACRSLKTKDAKNRRFVQKQFEIVCKSNTFNEEKFNNLYQQYKNYVDFNFTYKGTDQDYDMQQTLLICAQSYPHSDQKTQWLLNTQKIITNQTDRSGFTALMRSAQNASEPEAIILICQYPATNINQKNTRGETALNVICRMCQYGAPIFKPKNLIALLNAGADTEIVNSDGFTPLQIATQHNCIRAIGIIQEAINQRRNNQ